MSDQHKHLDLSLPTVVGGAVAAATAVALGDRLGLLGTVVGAAVMSVVTTIVAAGLGGWLERLRGVAAERDPGPWTRGLIGVAAVALVGVAFHTGLDLLTSDLPRDAFASRLLAQLQR